MSSPEVKESSAPKTVNDLGVSDIRNIVTLIGAEYTMPYEISVGRKGFERTFLTHCGSLIEIARIHPDTRDSRVIVHQRQEEQITLLNPKVEILGVDSVAFISMQQGDRNSSLTTLILSKRSVVLIANSSVNPNNILFR
jgi:hypothetical protein